MIKAICSTILIMFLITAQQVSAKVMAKKHKEISPTSAKVKLLEVGIEKDEKAEWKPVVLNDDTAPSVDKNQKKITYQNSLINDETILINSKHKHFKRKTYAGTVETEQGLKVVLRPAYKLKTGSKTVKIVDKKYRLAFPEIGQTVNFITVNDILAGDKIIIPRKTRVEADICEVSLRAMGGAPAEMSLDNFVAIKKDGERIPLYGTVSVSGYNLSMWIGLIELATTPFLVGFAAPVLRVFPGGQANLSPKKTYEVFYQN